MPFGIGLPELLLITFLALVFFGRNKVTALAADLGKSVKVFKQELSDVEDEVDEIKKSVKKNPTKTQKNK